MMLNFAKTSAGSSPKPKPLRRITARFVSSQSDGWPGASPVKMANGMSRVQGMGARVFQDHINGVNDVPGLIQKIPASCD